jgi:hypothetical protein
MEWSGRGTRVRVSLLSFFLSFFLARTFSRAQPGQRWETALMEWSGGQRWETALMEWSGGQRWETTLMEWPRAGVFPPSFFLLFLSVVLG